MVMNSRIQASRALMVGFIFELLTILIVLPTLLFAFKVTGRIKQLLGTVPASIIFFVAWLLAMYLDKGSSKVGHYTVGILIFSIVFTLILSGILFVVKGKASFFESNSIDAPPEEANNHEIATNRKVGLFCEKCGSQMSSTSKFCSTCGAQISNHD